jgi:diketogulonate reductase-like aldo/keto reductase
MPMDREDNGFPNNPGRRRFLQAAAGAALAPALLAPGALAAPVPARTRAMPGSGEAIPIIGMGTYITFDVGDDRERLAQRTEVLRTFFDLGGGMIDSSPMYGSAEAVLGETLSRLGHPQGLFSATKVWHWLTGPGEQQMQDSRRLWRVPSFDLMQVHNLVNWPDHLDTMRRERDAGLVRYIGVTTSHGRRHDELADILERQDIDFVQLTYNILDREAEERLLPLAAERGIAVIVNRPFRRGGLIDRFANRPLPDWAAEIDADNWPQFLLKFIVSHPAVTCAIPATSRVDHMRENMAVLRGRLPDPDMRREMIAYVRSL